MSIESERAASLNHALDIIENLGRSHSSPQRLVEELTSKRSVLSVPYRRSKAQKQARESLEELRKLGDLSDEALDRILKDIGITR